ncbi:MAG: IS66 family transposase [Nitrospinota bacterium]
MGKIRKAERRIIKQLEEQIRLLTKTCCSLEQKNDLLEETVKLLKEENAYLQFQIKEFQNKVYKKNKTKKDKDQHDKSADKSKKSKKRGAPWGHIGWFRKKPKKIDEVKDVTLDKCPECGSTDIEDTGEIEEHIQEDIVIPEVKAVSYQRHFYKCLGCGGYVEGCGEGELPGSYIGPVTKTVAVYLKYHTKVSDRDIQKIFQNLFGLTVDPSSIPGFRNQLRKKFAPLYKALLEKIKKSPFLHVDETGWRLEGKNHWLWSFSGKGVSLSRIQEGRGQKDLENVLGKRYKGILISDFLSAYNKIKTKAKQRCLGHLSKDLKKVREYLPDDEVIQRFCKRLKDIIDQARQFQKTYRAGKIRKSELDEKRKMLEEFLKDLKLADPTHKIIQTFIKRLERHKSELLTFLRYPSIDCNNNFAERQIRFHVLLRKIIFQNRSYKGILNHNVLTSIIQTAKLNGLNPLKVLQDLICNFDKPNALDLVIPP